jgi:hypothetical protein
MRRETVLAKIRVEISFTESLKEYLLQFQDEKDAWYARDEGRLFLSELGGEWNKHFVEVAQPFYQSYFREHGFKGDLPNLTIVDSRSGSWIMEAAITMFGTVGTAYTLLKAYSELPKIAEGIEGTNSQLKKELANRYQKKVRERIEPFISFPPGTDQANPPSIPHELVKIACSIDARPVRALTPETPKSHSIHLAVSITRSNISIENLGEELIANLRIGLFKSSTQMHSWNFGDAHVKLMPVLSGGQSIAIEVSEFLHEVTSEKLDLTDDAPLHVDCWLQDDNGIYLFNFYLDD